MGDIAARVDQGIKRLPKLLSNPSTRLVGVHRTGRCIFNGPKAPLAPNVDVLVSKEPCEYVRAVVESNTAEDAIKHGPPSTTPRCSSVSATAPRTPGAAAEAREAAEAEGEAVEADVGDVVVSTGPAAGPKDPRSRAFITTIGRML